MPEIREIETKNAKEFWDILSPERAIFDDSYNIIYRGQRDSTWGLETSIMRRENKPAVWRFGCDGSILSDNQVFYEFRILQEFVEHCDAAGIPLPNDSRKFRQEQLDTNNPILDRYIRVPR